MSSHSDFAKILSHSALLHGAPEAALMELVRLGRLEKVPAAATLLEEDARCPGLYILLEGGVEVSKRGRPVAQMGRGAFFGELSVFGLGFGATATLRSPQGCTVLLLERTALDAWFKQHTPLETLFYKRLAKELCGRLYATTEKLT